MKLQKEAEDYVFVNEDQEEALIEELVAEGMLSIAFLTAKEEVAEEQAFLSQQLLN
ncbi:hypothetical protein C2857_005487 [Epichloe festucae Fl1]|uniref:Uncharacterized protein n=1 Tax=Epichloe festucae (strain Fl1) TaxID=877507 RepID=A0A7S9PSM8_EPIFF|nr:hypothetical protein C2857_005487 [Epichloe festucae Fl1]